MVVTLQQHYPLLFTLIYSMPDKSYRLSDYDYHLPQENIAQHPAHKRDHSRLLVVDKTGDMLEHRKFTDIIDYLRPGDLVVVNDTKVFPARILGKKITGGRVELFLLEFPRQLSPCPEGEGWHEATAIALLKSSKRPKPGVTLHFSPTLTAEVVSYQEDGKANVRLHYRLTASTTDLESVLEAHGQVPLPPYISRSQGSTGEDSKRYQTTYAKHTGSVAAPTAGLHFSSKVLTLLQQKGVVVEHITLHVGYGTFAPVRTDDIRDHIIHREYISISPTTAAAVNRTKKNGGRIWAVGTTSVRTLEYATDEQGEVQPIDGVCDLFIYPGYRFRTVDNLITNFHLPQSSLLFLVSALAGRERMLHAYNHAVEQGYRFFSYGDAMAIITKG